MTISVRADGRLAVDVTRFRKLLGSTSTASVEALTEAVSLYRGDFMERFSLSDGDAFEEWQRANAVDLRRLACGALDRLVAAHVQADAPEQAVQFAHRLIAIDSCNEAAHRQLMRLYVHMRERYTALQQYAECARVLRQELGIMPEPETTQLYEMIKAGKLLAQDPPIAPSITSVPASAPVPTSAERPLPAPELCLPTPATQFFGRAVELGYLAQRLAEPTCRLLTLTGPGGVGKTRLAIEAGARAATEFPDGAAFVPLDGVATPEALLPTIASAFGLDACADPEAALVAFLRRRRVLLVLDTLEHVLTAASSLARILAAAPSVKILATSRERLGLRGEHEFPVDGLPCATSASSADGDDAAAFFFACARRASASFAPCAADLAAVRTIADLVDGSPLALELAATWTRDLSCSEIAVEVARDLDFLQAGRDAPERQRSPRAAFIHSFRLLSDDERGALRRLSVFHGGVHPELAARVAGAPLPMLRTLAAKSLLRRSANGLFELPALVRQFAAEALAEAPEELRLTTELQAANEANAPATRPPAAPAREQHATAPGVDLDALLANTSAVREGLKLSTSSPH